MVAGKPVTSIIPFMVVGFEGTILLGAVFTLVGLLLFCGLPFRRFPTRTYHPDFSKDRFGVWLRCSDSEFSEACQLLRDAGAEEVRDFPADTAEVSS